MTCQPDFICVVQSCAFQNYKMSQYCAEGSGEYLPLHRVTGILTLGFCKYEFRHSLIAIADATLAWEVRRGKAKPIHRFAFMTIMKNITL